ncbi:hypothetical protein [Leptospira brenneri]|uniref:Uncharacterized protein n=1 Tax=Leptospira brenneri TaxID=2023182 RepID=A0A2M9XXU7_9LEPT|nr:hypothetical protein [Leptospira brenneri]PJZ44185.1 hypothetical protein CH361_16190 [Leptospira brenneri]TGK92853.1 hypothetical protein EHQ30_11495 [Leptospira brenneri]
MKHFLPIVFFVLYGNTLLSESKPKTLCNSLEDCGKKAELTEIHRKKISLLTFGINEYSQGVLIQNLLPMYLKRAKSIILEANGETGYKGEITLKVSHKPEYKQTQLKKAEEDIQFLNSNQNLLSKEDHLELLNLKTLFEQSK